MAREEKPKTFHYRKAEFLQSTVTLQALLQRAHRRLPNVADRIEPVVQDGREMQVLNQASTYRGLFASDLLYFEPGTIRALVSTDLAVPQLNVATVAPPDLDGQRAEFLESVLFFAVRGNHVAILQSRSLRSKQLEEHLNWLLRHAGHLSDDDIMELQDAPQLRINHSLANRQVKSVSFTTDLIGLRGTLDPDEVAPAAPAGGNARARREIVAEGEVGERIVRAALGEQEFARLNLAGAVESNLRVSLNVSYNRSTDDQGERVLRRLASALRHIEPDDVVIDLQGFGRVKGTELKLTKPVTLTSHDGMFSHTQVFDAMHAWLADLITGGTVEEDNA